MYKQLFKLLTLLSIVVLLTSACGGQTTSQEQDVEATVEETQEATVETTEEALEATVEVAGDTDENLLGNIIIAPDDPIRIASALVIAGSNESIGIDSQTGVEIAIQEKGELLGHPIELQAEDGGCTAEGGQTAATKIAADPSIVAVVGHNCSSSCTPAASIYKDAGLTMISPSCTAPALTMSESHEESFLRTALNDKDQGRVMAEFVFNDLGLTSAATIHDGSPYAEQLQQVFADTFTELGGTITAQEAINEGDTDMRPVLTSIAVDSPELLYYPVFIREGSLLTVQAKEVAGLEETVLSGAEALVSPDFIDTAGEAANGMYMSGPDLEFGGDKYAHFLEEYMNILGKEPISVYHAHAYDAANMIFDAIEAVAETDEDGNTVIDRQALRDALYTTADFDGITGNLTCTEDGDCADPVIAIKQIQDGEFVQIYSNAAEDEELETEATDEPTAEAEATDEAAVDEAATDEATVEEAATDEPTAEATDEAAYPIEEDISESSDDAQTDFPLPDDAKQVTVLDEESGIINFQTGLTLEEAAAFYQDAFSAQGLTERTLLTVINDQAINLVFDGSPNGKAVVVQGFPLSAEESNISVRYEDQ